MILDGPKTSYSFYDEYHRILKKVVTQDDGTTTTTYIANIKGTTEYAEFLTWVASGNTANIFRKPGQGYDTVTNAKATKIAKVKDAAIAYIHDHFEYELIRNQYDSNYTITGETIDSIRRVFVVAEALITAINSGTSIASIRDAVIDFQSSTHDTVS